MRIQIPRDFAVKDLRPSDPAIVRRSCLYCERTWDNGVWTSRTPVPVGRCPFEDFHRYDSEQEVM